MEGKKDMQYAEDIFKVDVEGIREQFRPLRREGRNLTDIMSTRVRHENRFGAFLRETMGEDAPKSQTTEFYDLLYSDLVSIEDRPFTVYGLLKSAETSAYRSLINRFKAMPWGPHMKEFIDQPGLGHRDPRALARFFGEIGHPVLAFPHRQIENPNHVPGSKKPEEWKRILEAGDPFCRSVSQLWSYVGMGDPDRRHRVGMSQEEALACGAPMAKCLIFLLAKSAMMMRGPTEKAPNRPRSPYRDTYDIKRLDFQEKHQNGDEDDWSDAHADAAALRVVAKDILRDMWCAARRDLGLSVQDRAVPIAKAA
tara:strand:+ start:6141 stop:7070 length:930 start_codon:yes stop_codon:yes gene_type:complete